MSISLLSILLLIGIVILIIGITMFILSFVSYFSDNKWFCTFFGWHKAPDAIGFDGCSLNGMCPRCGTHVLQDSQGNWF